MNTLVDMSIEFKLKFMTRKSDEKIQEQLKRVQEVIRKKVFEVIETEPDVTYRMTLGHYDVGDLDEWLDKFDPLHL